MKRLTQIVTLAAASMLFAGAAHAATVSISTGSGGQLNAGTGVASNVAPLATELSVGFNLRPNVTLDASFLFAHDILSKDGAAKAAYVGFRPGIRAYGGMPWSSLRPYARIAVPVQYNAETKTAELGILVGGGLEYRLGRTVGLFGEALVTPYFTNGIVPIEGRVGVALHF